MNKHNSLCRFFGQVVPYRLQSHPDGIIAFFSTCDNRSNLLKAIGTQNSLLTIGNLFFAADSQYDLINPRRTFKSKERIVQKRFPVYFEILLCNLCPHSFPGACCQYDCRTECFFHQILSPSFRFGTAFKSQPCRTPFKYS